MHRTNDGECDGCAHDMFAAEGNRLSQIQIRNEKDKKKPKGTSTSQNALASSGTFSCMSHASRFQGVISCDLQVQGEQNGKYSFTFLCYYVSLRCASFSSRSFAILLPFGSIIRLINC